MSSLGEFDTTSFKNSTFRLDRPSAYLVNKARRDEANGYSNLKKSMESATVYIGKLSFTTTEEQLFELFSDCGTIKQIIMGLDKNKLTPTGFCFIIFQKANSALNAVKFLNKSKINGKPMDIDLDPGFEEGRQFGRGLDGGQKQHVLQRRRLKRRYRERYDDRGSRGDRGDRDNRGNWGSRGNRGDFGDRGDRGGDRNRGYRQSYRGGPRRGYRAERGDRDNYHGDRERRYNDGLQYNRRPQNIDSHQYNDRPQYDSFTSREPEQDFRYASTREREFQHETYVPPDADHREHTEQGSGFAGATGSTRVTGAPGDKDEYVPDDGRSDFHGDNDKETQELPPHLQH
ncbi:hypothetical protein FOA43_000300 [Brettanomyces nanus]|uniref:RRM domain-containing protein n=1 Tax=Eeniella nana TaxID=13502 RepID=A0A875RW57_EENNA|nr:uncharacterized protein FOA43_000300 [Brettanomyces nanus]QPG72996.1 hypothetical protein FOA43_000300 [Brettanomyces nanus]